MEGTCTSSESSFCEGNQPVRYRQRQYKENVIIIYVQHYSIIKTVQYPGRKVYIKKPSSLSYMLYTKQNACHDHITPSFIW